MHFNGDLRTTQVNYGWRNPTTMLQILLHANYSINQQIFVGRLRDS